MLKLINRPNANWTTTVKPDRNAVVTALASSTEVTCTFTNGRLVDLTVWKYRDLNADGDNEGGADPLLDGWEMKIYLWKDGAWQTLANQPPQKTVDGKVVFENLDAGKYRVCETPQTGWYNSDPGPGGPVLYCKDIDFDYDDQTPVRWFGNYQTTLTVVKEVVALPNDPQDFVFSSSAPLGNFTLDGDATSATPDSKTWVVAPGVYTIKEENAFKNPWYLDKIDCQGSGSFTLTGGDTASVTVPAGADVVCTFTNVKKGVIIVEKQAKPDGATQQFTFTGNAAGTIGDNGTIEKKNLKAGTYKSTETLTPGWTLDSIVCVEDGAPDSAGVGATATFHLQAGETITCTFTNYQKGHIWVDKITAPGANDVDVFKYTVTGTGYNNFTLTDVQAPNDQELATSATVANATYTVAEDKPGSLWGVTYDCVSANGTSGITKQAGARQATIVLDAGDTVRCTYVNKKVGTIIIKKVTQPAGETQTFTFTSTACAVGTTGRRPVYDLRRSGSWGVQGNGASANWLGPDQCDV